MNLPKTTLTIAEQTAKYGQIAIECRCGKVYLSDRIRHPICPHCGNMVELDPEEAAKERLNEQRRTTH